MTTLTTDTDLTNLVHDLATKQLTIVQAKAHTQATVEAAKKAFDDATADLQTEIDAGFAAINAYCAQHRDRLFPVKGSKRQKTLQILQHKLQYRSSSEVTAPEDIITRVRNRLADLLLQTRCITVPADLDAIEAEIDLLNSLIRTPAPELNKDAAGEALKNEGSALTLAPLGLSRTETETFKLTFTLTPGE